MEISFDGDKEPIYIIPEKVIFPLNEFVPSTYKGKLQIANYKVFSCKTFANA